MVIPVASARLKQGLVVTDGLVALARELARAAARALPPTRRTRRGATLRPGARTPLWNALVLLVRPHLRRYGAQSILARELGVPPQRIHDYFGARTAAPDAERVLRLLVWLAQHDPGAFPARTPRRAPGRVSRIK